jgi:hypothetical protein
VNDFDRCNVVLIMYLLVFGPPCLICGMGCGVCAASVDRVLRTINTIKNV